MISHSTQAEINRSNIQAGQLVWSAKRNKTLDVKGVFAAVCKHGFPMAALNLYYGEWLAYPMYVIKYLKGKVNMDLHIIYNIGCQLHLTYRKPNRTDVLEGIKLAVPAFHAYGHKVSCQMNYGIRHQDGVGLVDGEGVERLWSYLRPFSSSTKEMTAAKRTDTLTRAMKHYNLREPDSLSIFIFNKGNNSHKEN